VVSRPNLSSSLRSLCDLCVSAVNNGFKTLTAETQRTQSGRREIFELGHYRISARRLAKDESTAPKAPRAFPLEIRQGCAV